jgi:L-aminopeptidase/D-esterase-like protein
LRACECLLYSKGNSCQQISQVNFILPITLHYGEPKAIPQASNGNTIIGVVATNTRLTKEGANKVAQMAHDGLARTVRPAHIRVDGDTIFALSTGDRPVDVRTVGTFVAKVFTQAILCAVYTARSAGGLPALADLPE